MRLVFDEPVPWAARRSFRRCLKWIPKADVAGLDKIHVVASFYDPASRLIELPDGYMEDSYMVGAVYSPLSAESGATVTIFLEALLFPFETLIRFGPLMTLYFSRVVAHEVGHHVKADRGHIFSPVEKYGLQGGEEEMANRYAFEIRSRMMQKWYYRLADRLLKFFSKVHFEEGRQRWLKEQYREASLSWYKSWLLDLDNDRAAELYLTAKQRISAG